MATLGDILKHGGIPELQANPEKFKDLREEMRELAKSNLYFLLKACLGYDLLTPHIHWPMAQFCQDPPSRFTMLMAFRGGFKSTISTVGRTVQQQLRKPQDILIFSEAGLLAESWSREARQPFEGSNKIMAWLFPELQGGSKTSAKWGDSMWQLPHGGKVHAAGIDSGTMGLHVHWILMDDVFSDPKADKSPEYADRVLQFVKMSTPLLKNPATDYRVLVGVRWWLDGEPYAYFQKHLPKEHQHIVPLLDSEGKCIWPERFSEEEIDNLRGDPFVFASQYLLNPVSQETAIFKKDALHTYQEKPSHRNYVRVMAYDPAFSKERRSHNNAYAVGDVDSKGGIWIERCDKRKLDAHEAANWCIQNALAHDVDYLGVEANGPQIAFFQTVKKRLEKYPLYHRARKIKLVELKPTRDKVARWSQLASGCGTGQVRINQTACRALVSELYRVTGAKHEDNDLTDAAAHLVGPELSKKKPFKFTDDTDNSLLPHPLQDEEFIEPVETYMGV